MEFLKQLQGSYSTSSALHQPCLCWHCSVLGSDSEPTLTGSWLSSSQRPWIINDIRDFSKIGSDY